jgi:hypothetical protein
MNFNDQNRPFRRHTISFRQNRQLVAHPVGKGGRVRQSIEAKGCQLLFPAWAIRPTCPPLKRPSPSGSTYERRTGARTREALEEAICQALPTVLAQDARGGFSHCGYLPLEGSKQ